MDYLKIKKKRIDFGDIFAIPLFLPCSQMGDYLDYKKYAFRKDDIYAFGRLIDIDMANCNLVEVFGYVGKIPDTPEVIINSGRLFKPVFVVSVFKTGRWPFLFSNPDYDKWIDSDYDNITFLLHSEIWKGGKSIAITQKQHSELSQLAEYQPCIIYRGMGIERKIRSILQEQGWELHYEKIVEERREEYPKPRDIDGKLKAEITPFRWLSESGRYSLSLDAGMLNQETFEQNMLLGNGYDWEKVALLFLEKHMADAKARFTFDCEADTFSMQSSTKKPLKEFALAFHKCVTDAKALDELLREM